MNEELLWDNGTAFPEPCIDRIADTVGKVTFFFSYGKFRIILMREINCSYFLFCFILKPV